LFFLYFRSAFMFQLFPMGAKLAIRAGVVIGPPIEFGAAASDEILEGIVLIDGETIEAVGRDIRIPKGTKRVDARDKICVPGFIDLHVHGAGGSDLMDATPDSLADVARTLARFGTTSFYPTTVTASMPLTLRTLERLAAWIGGAPASLHGSPHNHGPVAQPLGIHMEGPFISHHRLGVHPPSMVLPPTVGVFKQFLNAAGEQLSILTLAPEMPGADEVIDRALESGVRVAMGHTDATFAQAMNAIERGVRHAVHTFNAMRPFGHRDPGVIAATLLDERVMAELIADGVHVDPAAIRLLVKAKGAIGVVLITDGVSPMGMPESDGYRLGEMEVSVRDGAVRNAEGKLAGSVLTLDRAVRNMREITALPLRDLVRMATWNPASMMHITHRKGVLAPGADADVVLLTQDLKVARVYARGREVN
jgi:N-acetylglucosamine-6-phosphate deacetylase